MSPFPANPSQQDVMDTFYRVVFNNIAVLNPTQVMHGMIGKLDWPPVDLDLNGGLYLVYLTSVAIPQKSQPAQQFMEHFLQWNWAYEGADIQPGHVDTNRGDRWRLFMAMGELINQSHFPGFAVKRSIAGYDPTSASGTFTAYSPNEMIYWTNPKCIAKYDKASGLLYGVATLSVTAFSTSSPLVDP